MRCLFRGGPRRGVVSIDFLDGGCADQVADLGHCVVDIAVDARCDIGSVKGVADERVGDSVLNRAQVDVGQRRLGHGADDAGHAGQLVGQRLVDHDVSGMGPVVRLQSLQPPIPFPRVQREEAALGDNVLVEHEADAGFPVQRQLGL